MGIMRRISPVLFLLVNFCLIWVSTKIAYFVVGVSRLDERKGYEITDRGISVFSVFFNFHAAFSTCLLIFYFTLLQEKTIPKTYITSEHSGVFSTFFVVHL
ncbi:hypothetical protein QT711_17800 [Sporosarcina saromensis]|uniref:Uncharacterized protein n=1 Tax=Sporosarcina saromensis TaxID=359365 RepID=A0ABU4GDE2_9BACL|nr:hypothetical protein [Sporosarcina saromensis]MDW0115018.1 hypothetical protein [Sporosarcina saromensis]